MRALRRLTAAVLAAALVVFGVLAVLEIVRATAHYDPAVLRWRALPDTLVRNDWADGGPRTAGAIACAAGVLLLLIALRRGRPAALELTAPDEATEVLVTRRGLRKDLQRTAEDVDGVERASVRVRRRSARVTARCPTGGTDGVAEGIRTSVEGRLDDLRLVRPLRVSVRTRTAS